MISFKRTVEIVEEFIENAIDGDNSFEEYCRVYGHSMKSQLAWDNYSVCVKSRIVAQNMGIIDRLDTMFKGVQKAIELSWNQLSVTAQNNAILTYKSTYIDDEGSCGHDEGLHLEQIEVQIKYMREYLSECEHTFNELGEIIS